MLRRFFVAFDKENSLVFVKFGTIDKEHAAINKDFFN